jgi:hypothetical protein
MRIRDPGWKIFGSGMDKHPGSATLVGGACFHIRVVDPRIASFGSSDRRICDPELLQQPAHRLHTGGGPLLTITIAVKTLYRYC